MPDLLDIYARVSRTGGREGKDNFWSPVEQVERAEAFAKSQGRAVGEKVIDLDSSGGTMDRPEFQRLIRRIESGASKGILVARLDRFGRTNAGIWSAVEHIRKHGGAVLSVVEKVDTSDTSPMGNAQLGMLAVMAQWQLDNVIAGWASVHERNVAMGVPNVVPFGYERVNGKGSTIVPTVEGELLVPLIFKWRAERVSPLEIARRLDGHWHAQTVYKMLRNRAYLGECRYGDLVNRDAWPALVTEDLFLAAQYTEPVTRSKAKRGKVAGLLRCGSCRYMMVVKGDYYNCNNARCPERIHGNLEEVDTYVENFLREQTASVELRAHDTTVDVGAMKAAWEAAKRKLDLFERDTEILDLYGPVRFKERLRDLLRAVEEAEENYVKAQPLSALPVMTNYAALSLSEQREIIASAIGCIFMRGRPGMGRRMPIDGRLHIIGIDDIPEDLPVKGYARYVIKPWIFPGDD
jgi:DNA invertase Pin-like site-specific DNA recombinase